VDVTLLAVIGLIALALLFNYTDGFHDSANSIATVVTTRVLRPRWAVARAAGELAATAQPAASNDVVPALTLAARGLGRELDPADRSGADPRRPLRTCTADTIATSQRLHTVLADVRRPARDVLADDGFGVARRPVTDDRSGQR
jgi:hypothetical protein